MWVLRAACCGVFSHQCRKQLRGCLDGLNGVEDEEWRGSRMRVKEYQGCGGGEEMGVKRVGGCGGEEAVVEEERSV